MSITPEQLRSLIVATRSCRRFEQQRPIDMTTLLELIDLARLGGSARNLQPLKYLPVNDPRQNRRIFPHLGWAGYLPDWPGPAEGERPAAYILCFLDTRVAGEAGCDLGIATQNLLLGATTRGLAGCRIASISPQLRKIIDVDKHLRLLLVLALGVPRERVRLEEAGPGDDIRYWRDQHAVHHVPKRSLTEVLVTAAFPEG